MDDIIFVLRDITVSDRNEYAQLHTFVSDAVMEVCRKNGAAQGDITTRLSSVFNRESVMARITALAALTYRPWCSRVITVLADNKQLMRTSILDELRKYINTHINVKQLGVGLNSLGKANGDAIVVTLPRSCRTKILFADTYDLEDATVIHDKPTYIFSVGVKNLSPAQLNSVASDALVITLENQKEHDNDLTAYATSKVEQWCTIL